MKEIHAEARVSPLADLEESVRGSRLVVGPRVCIEAFVKIKFAGGAGDVVIGAGSYLNSGTVLYSGNGIQIGEGVLIAANCTLAPVNHGYQKRSQTIVAQRFLPSKGGIIIEDDVWVGAGCVILDGAILRRGCVVGALSLVRGELESYGVYAGQPCVLRGRREG
jgi:acetyltransferase-like isoleucine patch superfamily enzyme